MRDRALARGVNVLDGRITYEAVAEAHDLEYTPLEDVLPLSRSRRAWRKSGCAARPRCSPPGLRPQSHPSTSAFTPNPPRRQASPRFSRRFVGEIRMIEYVTPAASEIVPTMKMTMPMRPRTVSMPNLE